MNLIKEASIKMPDTPEIKYHLAYAYAKQGEKETARTELVRLLKQKKNFDGRELAVKLLQDLNK